MDQFEAFGATHLAALAAGALLAALMIGIARRGPRRLARVLEVALALLMLTLWPLLRWYYHATGTGDVNNFYPLHLCDVAAVLGALTLLTHRRGLAELLYFWGLAGTMQGVITPALTSDFPHPRYFFFFALHLGVVVAALYGVLGLRIIPRPSAKWRAWLGINGYALAVGGFNALAGANYGFLCRKPETASLYDLLGPWPWYIGSASLMALAIFTLLDLPFLKTRRIDAPQIRG